MVRSFSLTMSAIILSSCATGTANIKSSDYLQNNEGIALTTCKTPNSLNREILLYPKEYEHGFLKFSLPPIVLCTQEGKLAAIKLEAGEYYASSSFKTADKVGWNNVYKFTIEPNKINYIGDLRIAVRGTNIVTGLLAGFDQPQIHISALDNRQETVQKLKAERPDIVDQYEIVFDIAKR